MLIYGHKSEFSFASACTLILIANASQGLQSQPILPKLLVSTISLTSSYHAIRGVHVSSARGKTVSRLGSRPRGESSECACHSLAGRSTGTNAAATSHDAPPQASTRTDHRRQQAREVDAGMRVVSALWCSEQQCGGATIPGGRGCVGRNMAAEHTTPPRPRQQTRHCTRSPHQLSRRPATHTNHASCFGVAAKPCCELHVADTLFLEEVNRQEGNSIKTDFPLKHFVGINARALPPLAL